MVRLEAGGRLAVRACGSDAALCRGPGANLSPLHVAAEVVAPGSKRVSVVDGVGPTGQVGCAQPSVEWTNERERIAYRRSPSWAMMAR